MKEKLEIKKNHLILCEGADELWFFTWWLNSKDLRGEKFFSEEIQVMDFGGIGELESFVAALKMIEKFDDVKSMLIIRDAEKDENKAINDIKRALKKNELPVSDNVGQWSGEELKTAYLLLPSLDNHPCPGTLEDLCVEILDDKDNCKQVMKSVEEFMTDLEDSELRSFSHKHKSKIHTYFSVTDKYVSAKIGEAAKWGAFDWKNERMKYLGKLLLQAKS